MIRAFVIAATVYGVGAPQMAEYRPDVLDTPLQNFHRDINHTVNDVMKAAHAFDLAHPIHRLQPVIDFSRQVLDDTGYPAERSKPRTNSEVRDDWRLLQATLSTD